MLVKNTVLALLAAAPAFALPTTVKAGETTVATTQPAANAPVKAAMKESSKSIQSDLAEKKAKFAKFEKQEKAAIDKEEAQLRTAQKAERTAAAKEKSAKSLKASAKGETTKHLHPHSHKHATETSVGGVGAHSHKHKRPAGLHIKTDNLKSHKSKLSATGSPRRARTPGSGRSHKSHRSHKSLKSAGLDTPRTGRSHKSHSGSRTPGTGRSHRSHKSLKSAGLDTPGTGRSHRSHHGKPRTPGTGLSHKSAVGTPTSARTPVTPGSALKTGASLKSAGPESPMSSPISPPFSGVPLSAGMQEHIKWTPTGNGGYEETISVDGPRTPAKLNRRDDIPATPASATPPTASASVGRTHRHSRKLQHKHTATEALQLNLMLLQAEKLVNGLEDQMNKPHTSFANLKRKMTKAHLSKLVTPKTPTTPAKPAV